MLDLQGLFTSLLQCGVKNAALRERGGRPGWKRDQGSARTSRSDQDMTAFFERAHELDATPQVAAVGPTATRQIATIKSKLASFWPPALIALGLLLTLGWNVGLVWLLYLLI
jgi:hypothetical protein